MMKVWQGWFLVRLVSCLIDGHHLPMSLQGLSLYVHRTRERQRERVKLSAVSSCKDANSVVTGPHPMTSFNFNYSTSLEDQSPNTATLGVRASTYEFWGETNIQSKTKKPQRTVPY